MKCKHNTVRRYLHTESMEYHWLCEDCEQEFIPKEPAKQGGHRFLTWQCVNCGDDVMRPRPHCPGIPKEKPDAGKSKVCPTCGFTENGMTPEEEKEILKDCEDAHDAELGRWREELAFRRELLDFIGTYIAVPTSVHKRGNQALEDLRSRYTHE